MHKPILLLILGGAIALTGCKNTPKDMADLQGGSREDSMMYYFGEMQANNYWQDAETDTLLRSEDAREDFMRGFRETITMGSNNPAYNKGLELGLRLALRVREFEDRYDVNLPEDVLAAALENSLKNEHSVNVAQAQKGFYNIKDYYELRSSEKDLKISKGKLAQDAKENGFSMISDTLFVKTVTPGSGPKYKIGDRLAVDITVSTLEGKEITTRQFPDSVTLGEGRLRPVVREAVLSMQDGQTCQFMTTPRTLMGRRYKTVYKLPTDQPVIFTVKAGRGAGNHGANPEGVTEVE